MDAGVKIASVSHAFPSLVAAGPAQASGATSMDFEFSAEQIQLRKLVRDFAEKEIARISWNGTRTRYFLWKWSRRRAKWGLLGAIFPEELGGSGFGYIEYSIIIEELARVDPSVASDHRGRHNSLCTNHIYLAGNEEQKRQVHSQTRNGRVDRVLVAHRTGSGIRCGGNAHHRALRKVASGF